MLARNWSSIARKSAALFAETLGEICHKNEGTMSIVEKIKHAGWGLLGIIIIMFGLALAALVIEGGAWLSATIYPWLVDISVISFAISIFILLPLATLKKTRGASGIGLLITSYIFGATLWVWSFLLVYDFWGPLPLFIGIFLGGIGVVPIAMLASMFKGEWGILGQLVLLIIITFGVRFLSGYIVEKAEQKDDKFGANIA